MRGKKRGRKSHSQNEVSDSEARTSYALRHRDRRTNYEEQSDTESDTHNGGDSHTSKSRQVRGRGGKRTPSTPRTMETRIGDSNVGLIAENTTPPCAQKTMETEMVESSVDLIARPGESHEQGGNPRLCSERATETELVDSGVELIVGNTKSCTPTAMETELVHSSVDSIGRGRGRGRIRGPRSSGRGGGRVAGDIGWGERGTRSRPSQQSENKGTSNPEPSLITEKGPSSSPEGVVRLCKKTILSWLIDCKLIEEHEQVCYMDGTKASANMTGMITRGGILCNCCQKELSVWAFEKHAGSDLRQPYEHIYLRRKATCLQDCQIAAWQAASERERRTVFSYVPKENAADQNDDACPICGDGGDLICCDKCPSTYHPSCMNLERVPHNDWLCPYCVCKYCGVGGDSKNFITCCQCDKKFHWGCFKESENEFSKETLDPSCSRLYCGPGCREIYEKMEGSLGIRNDIIASYSWRVVRQMDMTPMVLPAARNLHIENNSKVAVAWMLMNEAFETITDRHTGTNVVQSVVYSRGSNLSRINFSRFYTFVLEKDDEVIAAASIRFHGRSIAEMPFIATDVAYRGQGICRSLMRVIESFLCSLKVENLILPSAVETAGMWQRKYSFNEIGNELKRAISSCNILMFPRCLRLYKDLSKSITSGGDDEERNETDIQNGRGDGNNEHNQADIDQNGHGGDDKEHNETGVQNGKEPPQTAENETDIQNGEEPPQAEEQAERLLLDLNVDLHQEDE